MVVRPPLILWCACYEQEGPKFTIVVVGLVVIDFIILLAVGYAADWVQIFSFCLSGFFIIEVSVITTAPSRGQINRRLGSFHVFL